MATVREFFEREAADILRWLRADVDGLDASTGDVTELRRHARALRGSAQMARDDDATRLAAGLEAAARALEDHALRWGEELSAAVRGALEDAALLVRGDAGEPIPVVEAALARLRRAGVAPSTGGTAKAPGTRPQGSTHAASPSGVTGRGPAATIPAGAGSAAAEFRAYAARELNTIVAEIDRVLLAPEGADREVLEAVLRRQRPLMGAARLASIPVVEETLTAVDDITRMVLRLGVAVKAEWLDAFRTAHDVLRAAAERLQRGEEPVRAPALGRLRTLRDELTRRYGAAEAAAVPVELFFYVGPRALRRAAELRGPVERAVAADPGAREAVQEVFDLIQLALA